jgi:hypothetical protein
MLVAVTPGAVAPPLPLLLLLLELVAPLLLLLVVLLLLDDPQAATSTTTAATPTYASTLVPRNLIPLLLRWTQLGQRAPRRAESN